MFYALNRKQIIHNWTLLPSTSHIYCLEWYLMYATEIWVSLHWLLWYRDWWCWMNLKSVGRLHQFIASPDFLIACSSSVWSCCCIRMMPSLCPFYVLNCIILCATSRITSQILKPKRWQVWPRANRVYCGALDAKEAPKLSVSLIFVRTSKTWTEITQEVKERIKLTWKHI